jgi:hypothetical protein
MRSKILVCVISAALAAGALQAQAAGTTTPGSMLFTPTLDLSSGSQNSFVGTVGGVFLTSYSEWPDVNWLGYFDKGGDGLTDSHRVGLWDAGNNNQLLAQVTIPAGTTAPLANGYRWVALPGTVNLWYGHWYVIGAETTAADTWGDLIRDAQVSFSSEYAEVSAGYEWSRAGRYSTDAWPAAPSGQSGQNSIYPVANMAFDLQVVPEPSTLALFGFGALLFARALRGRRN